MTMNDNEWQRANALNTARKCAIQCHLGLKALVIKCHSQQLRQIKAPSLLNQSRVTKGELMANSQQLTAGKRAVNSAKE